MSSQKAAALALFALACGSNRPEIPPELLVAPENCSPFDYPEAPYGTEPGAVASNSCFKGWSRPNETAHEADTLTDLSFGRYYDPAGDRYELLLVNSAALWCSACQVEHEELPGLNPGKEGVLDLFRAYVVAFPDLRMEVLDLLASGDKTVARVKATGTQEGEFMGLPPSGRAVEVQLIDIMRFEDGLVVEHWGVMDMLSMLQQLGAMPDGLPA